MFNGQLSWKFRCFNHGRSAGSYNRAWMDRFFVEHADKDSSPDETSPVEEKALRRSGILLAAVGALLIVLSAFMSTSL